MRTQQYLAALAVPVALGVFAPSSFGAALSVSPSPQTVNVGDQFTVDLVADLAAGEDLAGFFADVFYDPMVIGFSSLSVSDALGEIGLDAIDLSTGVMTSGMEEFVNAEVISLLTDFTAQADSLVLASITFDALAAGTTLLEFGNNPVFDDPNLTPLPVSLSIGSVSVVSEPASLAVLALGVIGLGLQRRRR